MWQFHRFVNFEKDGEEGGDPPEGDDKDKKPEGDSKWTPEMQAEFDKRAAGLRKAAHEKGKAEAKAELEAAQKKAKEEADKKGLEEQGKFKDLATKAEKEKADALADKEKAIKEARELKMQIKFGHTVKKLEMKFVNTQAEQDAFLFLDPEEVGDDDDAMEKAVKALAKDRSYLFGDPIEEAPETDAAKKGKRDPKNDKDKEAELRSRFRIRTPR